MYEGAIFTVRQDGEKWVLTALDFDSVPSAVLSAGTQIGEFNQPEDMCRQITNHVQSLSKSGGSSGLSSAQRSGEQRSGGERV